MIDQNRKILVISPDPDFNAAIGAAAGHGTLRVRTEQSTLSGLNGRAVGLAEGQDLILVRTDPADPGELSAFGALARAKPADAQIVALADASISLAQVRALTEAGASDVLPVPDGPEALAAEVARLAAPRQRRLTLGMPREEKGRVIAVAPARGGIGATTLSVNLADRLTAPEGQGRKKPRHRVALVDLDLQFGAVGSLLDLPEQDVLIQIAQDGVEPDANFLRQSMASLPSGLSVLPAPARFAPLDALHPGQVAAMIEALKAEFDYVVVDLPHALVGWVEPVIARADALIVVSDTAVPSVRHCRRLIDFFTADNLALPVQVVVSGETNGLFGGAARRAAAKALDGRIGHWLPADPRHARTAADRGKPLSAVGGALDKAIARLARKLAGDYPVAPRAPEAR